MRKWHRRTVKWVGFSSLFLVALVLAVGGGGLLWLASTYSRSYPLDLQGYLPRIEKFLADRGVPLTIGELRLFYDGSPVVEVSDLRLLTPEGETGVFVEEAKIRLSKRGILLWQFSPKTIQANGVTLRLVRGTDSLNVAGVKLGNGGMASSSSGVGGAIAWLNGLSLDSIWKRLRYIKIDHTTLLLRDDVASAEWVLENGDLMFSRYPEDGERGTLTANLRRLYGDKTTAYADTVMPVLVTLDHQASSEEARISAKFDQTDAGIVADYLPPTFKDLLRARGEIELGTLLREGNKIDKPWVTLRLANVEIQPPKGFSKPMEFSRLTMTASYQPSPSDVLEIRDAAVVSPRGNVWRAQGRVVSLTTDPLIDLSLASEEGDIQGVFDFFPDQPRGFHKALDWLRPNISDASYSNLTARFVAKPSVFPHCEDACGEIRIDADVKKGTVRFLPELSPAVIDSSATFAWRGQHFTVAVPRVKIGNQVVHDAKVTLTNMFSPDPTHVLVSGTVAGALGNFIGELRKLDDKGRLPQRVSGTHSTLLNVDVPLIRDRETTFSDSVVTAEGVASNVTLGGLDELGKSEFTSPHVRVRLFPDKSLRIEASGKLAQNPLTIAWQDSIDPHKSSDMYLNVAGVLDGGWLLARADNPAGVSLTGGVSVAANLVKTVSGSWRFGVVADAGEAKVGVSPLDFNKPAKESMWVKTQGVLTSAKALRLDVLDVSGTNIRVQGKVAYDSSRPDDTAARLGVFRLGKNDLSLDYANHKIVVGGKRLDIGGFDLMGEKDDADTRLKNVDINVKVDELIAENGRVRQLEAQLTATDGQWDIVALKGILDGGAQLNIVTLPIAGKRRHLQVNVDDLGKTLSTFGIYERLRGGKLRGNITFTGAKTGSGMLRLERFQLDNPPLLVQLLSLISLEQLIAGTDSILFDTGVVPLRLDGNMVYLNEASLEGPSMSIGLTGSYMRGSGEINFDGRLAPAIPLNRLVAKIPLVGTLLTGSQDGVVVADFKLKGKMDDPQINVRPLSVLTPGLVKDFWRGLTGGGDTLPPSNKGR